MIKEIKDVTLGQDLRNYIMELLEKQKKFPKLLDYLASLWEVAEHHKDVEKVDFALIAEILEKSFMTAATPRKIDWKLKKSELEARINLDKIRSDYSYFENTILEQLIELDDGEKKIAKYAQWKNLDVSSYLERGTAHYEEDTEVFQVDWTELNSILHEGKYNE